MPKKIITKISLPKILRELDRWEGKLTWPLLCARIARMLGVTAVSRHTMYLYPELVQAFQRRQRDLRETAKAGPPNYTLQAAVRRVSELEAQVKRLQDTNTILLEQFRRWQYNAYLAGASMPKFNLDSPMPRIDRSGHEND